MGLPGHPGNSKNRLKTVKKLRPPRAQRLWDAPFLRCRLKIAPGCHFSQFLYQNCCREWSLFAPKSQPATSESTPVPTPTPSSEIVAIKTKVPQNREKVTGLLCTAVVGHSFLGSLTEHSILCFKCAVSVRKMRCVGKDGRALATTTPNLPLQENLNC